MFIRNNMNIREAFLLMKSKYKEEKIQVNMTRKVWEDEMGDFYIYLSHGCQLREIDDYRKTAEDYNPSFSSCIADDWQIYSEIAAPPKYYDFDDALATLKNGDSIMRASLKERIIYPGSHITFTIEEIEADDWIILDDKGKWKFYDEKRKV